MLVNFLCFCCCLLTFLNKSSSREPLSECRTVWIQTRTDSVRPDRDPNCFQRLTSNVKSTSKERVNCTLTLASIYLAGGTQRLSRIVGPSIAKELIFTGRIIDGVAANQIGLVNHVVNQNEAGDAAYHRAIELAQEIAPQVME